MVDFKFDLQRFDEPAAPTLPDSGYYLLTDGVPAGSGLSSLGDADDGYYLHVVNLSGKATLSVEKKGEGDVEDQNVTMVADDLSEITKGNGIAKLTLTGVDDDTTLVSLTNGDEFSIDAGKSVTYGGITYTAKSGDVHDAVVTVGTTPEIGADLTATLKKNGAVIANGEAVKNLSSSEIKVSGEGVITDLATGDVIQTTYGEDAEQVVSTYKVYGSYVTSSVGTETTRYKLAGSGELSLNVSGDEELETWMVGNNELEEWPVPASIDVTEDLEGLTNPKFFPTYGWVGKGEYPDDETAIATATYNKNTKIYSIQVTGETTLPVKVIDVSATIEDKKGKGLTVDADGDDTNDFTLAAKGKVTVTDYGDEDDPVVTVNSQSITFTDGTVLAVALKTGVVEIESDDAIVSSTGAITKLAKGDTVTAERGEDAEIEVSLNGTSYTLVTESDDTSDEAVLTMVSSKTAELSSGLAKLDKTHAELQLLTDGGDAEDPDDDVISSAKYTGSGSVIVGADGSLREVGSGDTVAITRVGEATVTETWTASGSALELKVKGDDTRALPTYWTIDNGTVSIDVDANGNGTPSADDVTEGISVATEFLFNGKKDSTTGAEAVATNIVNGVYVDKNGNTSLSSTGAVGKFSVTEDVVTYESTSAAGNQAIVIGDLASGQAWSVKGGSGKDIIMTPVGENAEDSGSVTNASISGGDGDDVITIVDTGEGYISGGAGKDTIIFEGAEDGAVYGDAGDDTIIVSGDGEHYVDGGDGNDVLTHTTSGTASLIGGKGNDTITARSADDYVEGGDGKDVFNGLESGMTINDYSLADDVVVVAENNDAISVDAESFTVDGTFKVGEDENVIDISASMSDSTYYAVKLTNEKGKKSQIVAWAKEDSSDVDGSTAKDNLVLIGLNNSEGDALKGGSGKDTIYAGSDDTVIAGKGNDSISIASEHDGAVYFEFSKSSGNDAVSGFNGSFDGGDQLWMQEGTANDLSLSVETKNNDTHVLAKLGSSKVTISGAQVKDTGAYEILVNDAKVALAGDDVIKASSADYADYYFGNKSTLSFADTDDDLNIDLRDTTHFRKISVLEGGKGVNTLIGSTGKDTIISGGGETSLWGGKGNDSLVGADDARDVFFFGAGDGKDTISGFAAYTEDTADAADIFNTNGANISEAKFIEGKGLQIGYNSTDIAVVDSFTSENDILQYSEDNLKTIKYAKVGKASGTNDFDYDAVVTAYVGGKKHDKVVVSGEAEVWLDGSKGVAYSSVEEIDASTSTDSVTLVGDNASNTITGGANDSVLWGGTGGSNDVLNGTAGATVYWYGYGEGNDIVNAASSSSAEDIVNLYNITGDMLAAADILENKVVLSTTAGQTLTVNTSHDVTFTLTDGTAFVANMSTHEWEQA